MAIYAIGDTHLSFSVDKPMDVFKGWDDYAQRLENNWQRLITDEDTVVINGDISWAMGLDEAEKDLEFLNNLNGTYGLLSFWHLLYHHLLIPLIK